MTFIRDALIIDLEDLTDQAEKFFEYAEFSRYGWALDRKSFKDLMRQYIESPDGVVLCLVDGLRVVGGIAGGIAPFIYDVSKRMALELYFWVEPDYRGLKSVKMFKEYEKRIKELGAVYSMLTIPDTNMEDKIHKFYESNGYKKCETRYVKTI